jgi:nucleoside-diphosphate-sugar epimerase
MKIQKLLVCGATGFIGRNIAEAFAQSDDFEVFGTYLNSEPLDNPKIKMIQSDLTDKDDVNRTINDMDIIIQAAATTSGVRDIINRPYYHVTDNALMNSLIFRVAFENKVSHVVFFSCTVMYQSSATPIKETDFDANMEIYPSYFGVGWTKVYIEKMCEFYSRVGKTKYTVIRHSNIYGPYDKYDLEKSHVFGATMTKIMTAKDGDNIVVWGNGEEERDLLYVSSLVDFVELAIRKQKTVYELYNVGYGSSVSVSDLVKKIIYHSDKDLRILYDTNKPSLETKICLDTNRARRLLGWSPKTSFDEGVQNTMEWYRANIC